MSARTIAVRLLTSVLSEKRPLDEAMARNAELASLEARDRNFTRLMVMTALRRLGQIDALLSGLLAKPLTGKSDDVMHCLRLGAVQLLWLETPAHAAVHAMVETVSELGHARMKGLVNVVLKRVASEGAAIIAQQDEARLSLPAWLVESWSMAYGEETMRAIARARLSEPPLDITVKQDAAGWSERLGASLLANGTVRLMRAGKVEDLDGYAEGHWWVQDVAASLPVQLLADVTGLDVLDLCAAPGGKTAQLCAQGARVTAVDKSPRRLATLQSNLDRLKLQARLVEADIVHFKPDVLFDVVLLDAPCSATGTVRRHPEVAWHKQKRDVDDLARQQRLLLNRAASWVKPGGKLLYCVCSLEREEGEMQAETFLRAHPDYRANVSSAFAYPEFIVSSQSLRTHPACLEAQGGMDGFYAICLQRLNNI